MAPPLRRSRSTRTRAADSIMWNVLVRAGNDWLRHRDARLGSALAYYSVFSLGPLLLIVVSVAGLFFGREAVGSALNTQLRELLGPAGSQAVDAMLQGAGSQIGGSFAVVVGILLLMFAALGVVLQLKDALNTIWETRSRNTAVFGNICGPILYPSRAYLDWVSCSQSRLSSTQRFPACRRGSEPVRPFCGRS